VTDHQRGSAPSGPRAVFLDRDGVINDVVLRDGKPFPPDSLAQMKILPGVPEAISALHEAGLRIVVVTNQPDVRTGLQRREVVDAMHDWLGAQLAVDEFRACFHVDADGCSCRKPAAGMLFDAALAGALDLQRSYLVGDRWRDIDAGRAAGCRTFWIDRGYRERRAEAPDFIVSSLAEAAGIILAELADCPSDASQTRPAARRGGDPARTWSAT
jgi:D-glycero-D-manno-heptose 1,7-bisphosphate phosphatase